ncbi:MAG: hypothetical protein GKR89_23290 [Candidatus Latescibacteria bacterium]|nr:hypothetical protein [Candidatus Latescibacterota bacterium]
MCTIGAVTHEGRTFLLKNFDYPAFPTGWAHFHSFDGGHDHFALVDHDQQGLNSGLNAAGLGLQISRSKCLDEDTPERVERRTVLNAEVLNRCSRVEEAVQQVEDFARAHPDMLGGNVMLADLERIAVSEYFNGQVQSEVLEKGFLARANHSILGVVDNETEDSVRRYERMVNFLQELFAWFPALDGDDIVERCRKVLRQEPLLNTHTRSSFVVDIEEQRVDYKVGDRPWQTFRFGGVV